MSSKKQISETIRNANTGVVPDTTENRQILLEYLSQVEEKYKDLGMRDYESPCFALVRGTGTPPVLSFAKLNDELLGDVFVLANFCDCKVEHLNKTWAEIKSERTQTRAAHRKELESQGFPFGTEQDLKNI